MVAAISGQIVLMRGRRVLLDADLASLYGVPTKALNRSHSVTGSQKHRDPRFPPFAFTEHGAIMVATVLNSPRAVDMSLYVVRAFLKLRATLTANRVLARKLAALERSLLTLDARTRRQFKEVYETIRVLIEPAAPRNRPIGFTADLEPQEAETPARR